MKTVTIGSRAIALSFAATLAALAGLGASACSSSSDGTTTPAPGDTGGVDSGAVTTRPDSGGTTTTPGTDSGTPPTGDVDSGSKPPPPPDAAKACADAAEAVCNKFETCSPFVTEVLYGDVATCKARFVLSCTSSFTAPGTSNAPAKTAACAKSVGAVACATFLAGDLGADCNATAGTLAAGAACRDDAQCASTFCARAPDSECGTCAATTKAGDACVNQACSRGTTCPKGATKCITPVAGKVGDACTVVEECDLAGGVACNTSSKKCIPLTVATTGQTCGSKDISGTAFVTCAANGTCSALLNGKCVAAAADGATCSTADTGPHCVTPAVCAGGKCKIPDPTNCK